MATRQLTGGCCRFVEYSGASSAVRTRAQHARKPTHRCSRCCGRRRRLQSGATGSRTQGPGRPPPCAVVGSAQIRCGCATRHAVLVSRSACVPPADTPALSSRLALPPLHTPPRRPQPSPAPSPVPQPPPVQKLAAAVPVPDVDPPVPQLVGVGAAADEPQQLLHHACCEWGGGGVRGAAVGRVWGRCGGRCHHTELR